MAGSHAHGNGIISKKMWIATVITFTFCLFEAIIGYQSNSLALMADAAHNFADAFALGLSAFALWMASKPADDKRTFGYHRVGILAALVNAVGLAIMSLVIFWEAVQRLQNPETVNSNTMIWVALVAIVINSGIAWWLSAAAKNDLNIRSAYLHMVGDAAASLAVVIAGVIILFSNWYIADPIVSIIFAFLVLWSSWSILTESIQMLLEGTPVGLDLAKVKQKITEVQDVLNVHDVHVWAISSGLTACNCHILIAEQNVSTGQQIQQDVTHMLEHDFNINHATIQIEVVDCNDHDHMIMVKSHHEHA